MTRIAPIHLCSAVLLAGAWLTASTCGDEYYWNNYYIGGGQFIHAPHTGDVVKISSLSDSWYASTYVGAKRVT